MNPIKKARGPLLALALAAAAALANAEPAPAGWSKSTEMVPKGWVKAGSLPQMYEVVVLRNTDGRSAVTLRSTGGRSIILNGPTPPDVFGTLMQTISAANYTGQRLRLTAAVQADGVQGWAGLWMRVDGALGKVLAFDNMEKHPIKGTSDSRKYSVVLDVPANAQSVSYGLLLDGAGTVTMTEVRVKTVGKDVPITSGPEAEPLPARPQNLDFAE